MSGDSPSAPERFPDLYALLGLQALEPDRARIQQSLKRLAGQIQTRSQAADQDATSRAQVQRARKLFEFSKLQLLDPARKARYDQQWQAVYGASSGTSPQVWDLTELQALLPAGDPSAPFGSEEYLASRTSEVATRYAEDFDKLLSLLAPQSASDGRGAVAPTAAATAMTATPANAVQQSASGKPVKLSSTSDQSPGQPASLTQPTTTPLAKRLRNKQGPPLLGRAVGVLVALGIVLGVAYWRLQPMNNSSADDSSLVADPGADSLRTQSAASGLPSPAQPTSKASAPRRSGLPSVPGIEAIMPTGDAATQPAASGVAADMPLALSGMQSAAMQDAPMQSAAMQDSPMRNPPAMEAAQSQTVALSDEERQRWTVDMLAAREAIGQQRFAQATAQLESLQALAKTPLQTQQLTRLATTWQLAQRFRQALDAALAGMGAAESFSFGASNLASFVEADAERVILRIEGRNQTFAMPQLPLEIALAIVDLSMDREHPQSLAAKAAFIAVHPAAQGDDRAVEQARQLMATAVSARAVAPDMQQSLQDSFELP